MKEALILFSIVLVSCSKSGNVNSSNPTTVQAPPTTNIVATNYLQPSYMLQTSNADTTDLMALRARYHGGYINPWNIVHIPLIVSQ
jgi:hypothetical protein